jgi:hypothetical protein
MIYFIETPDEMAELDYEEERIAVLRAWEKRAPAIELVDPVNWITGQTQSIPHKVYAVPEAINEQSEG